MLVQKIANNCSQIVVMPTGLITYAMVSRHYSFVKHGMCQQILESE